jgi:hypothetical protein
LSFYSTGRVSCPSKTSGVSTMRKLLFRFREGERERREEREEEEEREGGERGGGGGGGERERFNV